MGGESWWESENHFWQESTFWRKRDRGRIGFLEIICDAHFLDKNRPVNHTRFTPY